MNGFDETGSIGHGDEDATTVINVEVYQEREVIIPESVAAEIAFSVCTDFAAVRADKEPADINITAPSDNKYETDGFHLFLALTSELSISKDEISITLGGMLNEHSILDLHTSIAEERVDSDDIKTGLTLDYDVVKGRFRRRVREYEHEQVVDADIKLINAVQDGDENSLEDIFNRNGDAIISDLLRHGHDAPNEIFDLAEEAVRKLLEAASPDELANFGLDTAVRGAVQNLIFEMVPLYREEVEKEQRESSIRKAVSNLKTAQYIAKLIWFEEEAQHEADEFIESTPAVIDKQQAAVTVKAGLDHFRARAYNKINPGVKSLDRISNPDKRVKRFRELRDEFRANFSQHIIFSAKMKQMGLEAFDILDIYKYTDQGHSRQWRSFLNRIIDSSTETK